ncbi:hypothetical protein LEMLEM_LOCUS15049, partial [Lemmus lemmus]
MMGCFFHVHQNKASLWPLVATWAMYINTDPNGAGTMDPDVIPGSSLGQDVTMALDDSAGLSDQHCSSFRTPLDTNMAPGGGPDPQWQQAQWISTRTLAEQEPQTSTQTTAVARPWTKTWPLAKAQTQTSTWSKGASWSPTSTCSLLPSSLQICLSPLD